MGYHLEAFICLNQDKNILTEQFINAVSIDLEQGLCLIPLTSGLLHEINADAAQSSIITFEHLNLQFEEKLLQLTAQNSLAYVEAIYHGGQGGQSAIIWHEGRRHQLLPYGPNQINEVLKYFGVVANKNQDEFQTVGLGVYRNTDDWISAAE